MTQDTFDVPPVATESNPSNPTRHRRKKSFSNITKLTYAENDLPRKPRIKQVSTGQMDTLFASEQRRPTLAFSPSLSRTHLVTDNDEYDTNDQAPRGFPELLQQYRQYAALARTNKQASAEQKLEYEARTYSIEQNARFMSLWMIVFVTFSVIFFVYYGELVIEDALLFTMYSLTTAGFGSIEIPFNNGFLIATVIFIYVGLASVTTYTATLYQWVSLNAQASKLRRTSPKNSFLDRFKRMFRTSEVVRALVIGTYLLVLLWTGAVAMMIIEGWNAAEAFYFATYVMTTVGYGVPVAPTTKTATWFCVFWLPFNISFLSLYMGNLGRYYYMFTDWNARRIEQELKEHTMQLSTEERALIKAIGIAITHAHSHEEKSIPHIHSMKDVLTFVLTHMAIDEVSIQTPEFKKLTPKQQISLQQWLILPSQWGNTVFAANQSRKPSLPLLVLVQERMAQIIATEIAHHVSPCIAKSDSTVSLGLENIDDVLEKWMIPVGPAQVAFRGVALEALVVAGKNKMVSEGADAIFRLGPFDVFNIFSPLLAALGDAGTMETWLARTQKLAETSFPRDIQV